LTRRFRQLALIFVAVGVAAATVTTMADFSLHARRALAHGLAAFGPNLVVRPEVGAPPRLPASALASVRVVDGVARAAGVSEESLSSDGPAQAALGSASGGRENGAGTGGLAVVAVTSQWPLLHTTWALEGSWPESGQVVVGTAVSEAHLRTVLARHRAVVSGRLTTGDRLDGALIVPWSDRESWGFPSGFQQLEVRTTAALATSRGAVRAVAAAIERQVPGVEAQAVLKVSRSDADLSSRVTLLLAAVSLVTLMLSGLAVMTATSALVGERRAEFALWFALGAESRRVSRVLALELLAASLLAATSGAFAGLLTGAELSRRLLALNAALSWSTTGVALATAAGVALLVVSAAMVVALRRIRRLEPATILAGE